MLAGVPLKKEITKLFCYYIHTYVGRPLDMCELTKSSSLKFFVLSFHWFQKKNSGLPPRKPYVHILSYVSAGCIQYVSVDFA